MPADGPRSGAKLDREARREALLDVAAELVNTQSLEAVSMDSVAARAGVSRPLVYKHFASRDELLAALYRREASHVHHAISRDVASAASLEDMFRRLVRSALRSTAERGAMFAQLRASGAWSREVTRKQRTRDAATARAFTRRAADELGLELDEAGAAIRMLLGMIDNVLAQYRSRPGEARAAMLEETYMKIVQATLAALRQAEAGAAAP